MRRSATSLMSNANHAPTVAEIISALATYDIGAVREAHPLRGDHLNDPHLVSTDRGRFFVKLLRPEFGGLPALEARHAFIEHLVARGVRVPRLMRTRDGASHLRLGRCVLEVYEFIEGRPYEPGSADDAWAAGEALASLHLATADFRPPSPGVRRGWLRAEADLGKLTHFEEQMRTYVPAPEAFAPIEQVKSVLRQTSAALAAADLPPGMIHGDFLPENLVYVAPGGPVATDFDYCHQAPLIFDLATAIIGFAGDDVGGLGVSSDPGIAAAAIAGYGNQRPLSEAERELLDPAVRRVLVHLLLDRGSDPDRIVRALDGCQRSSR